MQGFLTTIHVLGCLLLIVVVMVQSGRGGGVGAAFAGASGQLFGGRGASVFLTRLTASLAACFFLTSLVLSTLSSRQRSVLLRAPPAASTPSGQAASGAAPAAADGDSAPADPAGAPPGRGAAEPAPSP